MEAIQPLSVSDFLTQALMFTVGQRNEADDDGSGYDEKDSPTPDNMWLFTDIDCDWQCGLYSLAASILIFWHLITMMHTLNWWAEGNLFLLFQSAFTVYQYVNSTSLVWNANWIKEMPQKYRFYAFVSALLSFVMWISGVIGEFIRAFFKGDTPLDTNQEVLMAYWLAIHIPEAFMTLGTIIMIFKSGELSPSSGRDDDEDEVDIIDHGPQITETKSDLPESLAVA